MRTKCDVDLQWDTQQLLQTMRYPITHASKHFTLICIRSQAEDITKNLRTDRRSWSECNRRSPQCSSVFVEELPRQIKSWLIWRSYASKNTCGELSYGQIRWTRVLLKLMKTNYRNHRSTIISPDDHLYSAQRWDACRYLKALTLPPTLCTFSCTIWLSRTSTESILKTILRPDAVRWSPIENLWAISRNQEIMH